MDAAGFEEVEHTADVALRARGASLRELLLHAAQGMQHLAGVQPAEGRGVLSEIRLEASDAETLLVAWLEELLYRAETREVTFTDLKIDTEDDRALAAEVLEVPIASVRRPIKAVTFHDLGIRTTDHGLEATVVFDV